LSLTVEKETAIKGCCPSTDEKPEHEFLAGLPDFSWYNIPK
jgi:hypothetical protein